MAASQGRARRASAVLAAAVVSIALFGAVPVDAGTLVILDDEEIARFGVQSVEEILDLAPATPFSQLGFTEVEQQLIRGVTMPITPPVYGFGDDQDGAPVINPPGTDAIGMGNLQVTFAPGQLPAPGMNDQLYFVSQGDLTGGGPTTLMWVEFGSNVDLTNGLAINEGGVFSRPSMEGWASAFDADTWIAGDLFPTATYNPNPFELTMFEFVPPQSFPPNPDIPGFVMRTENYLIIGVDTAALTAADPLDTIGFGFHMHHSESPFTPGIVSAYPPPRSRTPEDFPTLTANDPLAPGTYCCFVEETPDEPADEPVDEPSDEVVDEPAEEPSDEVVDEPAEEPSDETVDEPTAPVDEGDTDEGDADGGSFREWVPIVLVIAGVAILVGGFWIYYRTRERDRPGTATGGGKEPPPPPPEQPGGGTPPAVGIPVGQVEHTSCDWELHYWTGSKWEVLRPAPFPNHKCCIYKVKVETKVKRHEQAAKFRQDVQAERLYIPDFDFAWRGMDFDANTSTRSGPEGRLDWMHGLGDPIEQADQAPDEAYWQSAQGEEPPEVAAHLAHDETTRISVQLEAGCTDAENTYTSSGDSSLSVMATQECTNDDPAPECPVELNAFGWQWGELNWMVYDEQGTDPDELERLIEARKKMDPEERSDAPAKIPVHRTWDSHDHGVRDRMTYEGGDFDSGSNVKEGMSWTTWVDTEVELDAGQLVPMHVWPTTERVTTHIEQQMTHSIKVGGKMKKGDCATTGCCTGNQGHVCHCDPEFSLTVDSAVSKIEVDGKTFRIERDPAAGDRRSPPAAGAGYKAWKLV